MLTLAFVTASAATCTLTCCGLTCCGLRCRGRVEIIPNEKGNRITTSYVAFDGDERFIGDAAKNQAAINQYNFILQKVM